MTKGCITKCLVQVGCLIGFQPLCCMLKDCKFTMICLFGMQNESATNFTTKTTKRIGLLEAGEPALPRLCHTVVKRYE